MSAEEDFYGDEMPMEGDDHMMEEEHHKDDDHKVPSANLWGIFAAVNTFAPLVSWISIDQEWGFDNYEQDFWNTALLTHVGLWSPVLISFLLNSITGVNTVKLVYLTALAATWITIPLYGLGLYRAYQATENSDGVTTSDTMWAAIYAMVVAGDVIFTVNSLDSLYEWKKASMYRECIVRGSDEVMMIPPSGPVSSGATEEWANACEEAGLTADECWVERRKEDKKHHELPYCDEVMPHGEEHHDEHEVEFLKRLIKNLF